jgi:hypothetical protein
MRLMDESRWAELAAYLLLREPSCKGDSCQCHTLRQLPPVQAALERCGPKVCGPIPKKEVAENRQSLGPGCDSDPE